MNAQSAIIRPEFPGNTIFDVTLKSRSRVADRKREIRPAISRYDLLKPEIEHHGVPESPLND